MDWEAPRRCKLIVDLTRYDKRCVVGSLGVTTKGSYGYASFDHFTEVRFDSGAVLPVVFKSLEFMKHK